MPRCGACGEAAGPENSFCTNCGSPLSLVCASCGRPVDPTARFCGRCGAALHLSGAASSGPLQDPAHPGGQPVAERRVCSVLFADLVGFTSLAQSRDPEDVRSMLSRYFEVARTIVARYGGVVEKFIGDAVMAVWGTPVAEEGDTERAVRAALDLVAGVGVLGEEVGAEGLSARAGVVTGEVAVMIGAPGEGMVAGDAVNTASRIQGAARAGTVFVDDPTRRLCESAIAFAEEGVHELKGKDSPQALFRAVSVMSRVGGSTRHGLDAPFTGRGAELRTLKELFHASAERRAPRLVVVFGPAGVGKSRLGWELDKYVDGLADTVLWHRGHCLSYGDGVTFWALSEIVRHRFGIAEEDTTEVASAKLAEGMVRFVADAEERSYVGLRLARLLGLAYPGDTKVLLERDELFAGWRLFFERLAAVAPVVMLVEDAQHADDSLLDFFDHLVDWSRNLPIFVVFFARPGLQRIDAGYGVGRNRSTLSLDPLDDVSMGTLLRSLIPGVPPGPLDAMTAHAEGIPLFAVETVRSLIDRGVLLNGADGYRLVGDVGTLMVPDNLHSLLAARLDALDPQVRALVGHASVLGTTFSKESLLAISDRDEAAVAAGLADLVRRDVLEVSSDPLSPQRGAYRFSQEMLRQVAYQTLSKKERRARHLAVASHLRSSFANEGEEIAEVIARHYLDARGAEPQAENAAEMTAEALTFLIRAGNRAERSGALGRAAANYAAAAGISPPEQSARLLEKASRASHDDGEPEAALSYAEAAERLWTSLGDSRDAARAVALRAAALRRLGKYAAARRELVGALAVLRPEPDEDTIEAVDELSSLEVFAGDLAAADKLADEVLALGQALGVAERKVAGAFITKGTVAFFTNRYLESVVNYEAAARLYERAGDSGMTGLAQLNLAEALAVNDPRAAIEIARVAADHTRRTGRRGDLAYAIVNIALPLLELGEWGVADVLLEEAAEEDRLDDEIVDWQRGLLLALRGDTGRASQLSASLAARASSSEEVQAQAGIALLEAVIADADGRFEDALSRAREVVGMSGAIGIGHEHLRWAWPLAARAARRLGDAQSVRELLSVLEPQPAGHLPPLLRASRGLVKALGEAAAGNDVADGLSDAVGALRELSNPYELAHGLVAVAGTLRRSREQAGRDEALEEARTIARSLGCRPLADRVDEASRGSLLTS